VYLSRIKLDLGNGETKRAISSPQVLHAAVENCFNEKSRTLWRLDSLEGNLYLLLISESIPDFEKFANQFCEINETGQTKNYETLLASIKNGQKLRFRFKGNPVHSVVTANGVRGKVTPHVSEYHKREWFLNKAKQHGFSVHEDQFALVETGIQQFYRKSNQPPVRLSHATFEGILTVEDAELFAIALTNGIGRAKAYGCGLITVMAVG
jgi:CRISPR system Cascade subunit CasE